jgi:AraC-like DNA-binding protein
VPANAAPTAVAPTVEEPGLPITTKAVSIRPAKEPPSAVIDAIGPTVSIPALLVSGNVLRNLARHLEGLCDAPRPSDASEPHAPVRIKTDGSSGGIERLDVQLTAHAFSRHRHDTYAIGVTLFGVQRFFYRGEIRQCLPGQCHVLHPDEVHDGCAGTVGGFRYRIAYVDPALVQQSLDGFALPFAPDPIIEADQIPSDLRSALWELDEPMDGMRRIDVMSLLSFVLMRASGQKVKKKTLRLQSLLRVRDLIVADPGLLHSAEELELVSGLTRWEMARQFRAAFGTSPTSFRTMRQLDEVRHLVRAGCSLSEAALQAGFSDQSHMSRMFKRTYGLTPRHWQMALAGSRSA